MTHRKTGGGSLPGQERQAMPRSGCKALNSSDVPVYQDEGSASIEPRI